VLTELGRALVSAARVKHNIKRIDRLLGNRHLALERVEVYQALAHRLVGTRSEPLIVIDWSDLTADRRWQLLRAAVPIGGRWLASAVPGCIVHFSRNSKRSCPKG
jgi:hypothetical protein